MKQFFLNVVFFVGAAFSTYAQTALTLNECVELAQKHHPQAAQIEQIRQINALQTKILQGAYLPQANIGGQATWQSDVTSVPISLPNFTITPPPQDQYKVTLDVNQTIWDGGVTAQQKKAANAMAASDEQKVVTDLYQLREQVSTLYFGILFAEKQKATVELLHTELLRKIERLQVSAQNGVATKANVLQLEARLVEVEQQLLEIQKRKNAALEGLSILTGRPLTNDTKLQELTFEYVAPLSFNRPELALFDAQKSVLAVNENLVKAKYMPKIMAFGTGGYGKPGLNMLSNEFKAYFIGGVQLKIPISQLYTGGQRYEIQQLKINQDKIEKQKEAFIQTSEIRLANQRQEIERLEALILADSRLITMRTKIRETADVQLENGIITSSDYLTELNNESVAKQNLILHETQLQQAKNQLLVILGR